MHKIILLLLFLFVIQQGRSQDTIIKKSGAVVFAKVTEINDAEVKYYRSDIPGGPLYVERKADLYQIKFSNGVKEIFKNEVIQVAPKVQDDYIVVEKPLPQSNKIDYFGNQFTHHNNRVDEAYVQDLLLSTKNKKIVSLVKKAKERKSLQLVGLGAIPLGAAAYVYFLKSTGLFNQNYYGTPYNTPGNSTFGLNNNDLAFGSLFLVGAISCPIASGIFKKQRNSYNREAIKVYNEKF